jgi:hypothetical protein
LDKGICIGSAAHGCGKQKSCRKFHFDVLVCFETPKKSLEMFGSIVATMFEGRLERKNCEGNNRGTGFASSGEVSSLRKYDEKKVTPALLPVRIERRNGRRESTVVGMYELTVLWCLFLWLGWWCHQIFFQRAFSSKSRTFWRHRIRKARPFLLPKASQSPH